MSVKNRNFYHEGIVKCFPSRGGTPSVETNACYARMIKNSIFGTKLSFMLNKWKTRLSPRGSNNAFSLVVEIFGIFFPILYLHGTKKKIWKYRIFETKTPFFHAKKANTVLYFFFTLKSGGGKYCTPFRPGVKKNEVWHPTSREKIPIFDTQCGKYRLDGMKKNDHESWRDLFQFNCK